MVIETAQMEFTKMTKSNMSTIKAYRVLESVKAALRSKYAWPGGYPLYIVMADGGALSIESAKENWAEVCRATISRDHSGWHAVGAEINWEDADLHCDHSGVRIESAYAENEIDDNA